MYYKELLVKVLYIDAVRVNAVKFMYFKNYEISKGTYMYLLVIQEHVD